MQQLRSQVIAQRAFSTRDQFIAHFKSQLHRGEFAS